MWHLQRKLSSYPMISTLFSSLLLSYHTKEYDCVALKFVFLLMQTDETIKTTPPSLQYKKPKDQITHNFLVASSCGDVFVIRGYSNLEFIPLEVKHTKG
jgi:hypothetical protein